MSTEAARRTQFADAPTVEPMRGPQRRGRSKPTREDLKVRRRQRRSQTPSQVRTALLRCSACGCAGYGPAVGTRCPSCASLAVEATGAYDEINWDEIHPHLEDIHRGVGLMLPDALHHYVHDEREPVHERARALLNHISQGNETSPWSSGLGLHWTTEPGVASDFGEKAAEHEGTKDKAQRIEKNDLTWGRELGDPKTDELHRHVYYDHGITDTNPNLYDLEKAHERAHGPQQHHPGQAELFHADPGQHKPFSQTPHYHEFYEQGGPAGKPGTAVVLHSPPPAREDIDEDVHSRMGNGDVYHYEGHGEREVPIRPGASVPVTGISWRPKHQWEDEPDPEPQYVHHTFKNPEHREARMLVLDCLACGHMTRLASKRCRACGSLMIKTATVLPTQIERANPGDMLRTPQGQVIKVKQIRPHETENDKVYVDTDMGTSIMSRGTDVNLVQGERQEELPDSGNPMGNTGQLPGAGRTPTGEGGGMNRGMTAAPDCPRDGTKMVLRGNVWVCPVDGTTAPTSSAPAGMHPTDRPSGRLLQREPGRKPPQTHLWASKYRTAGQLPAIVRRAREMLDTMEETGS